MAIIGTVQICDNRKGKQAFDVGGFFGRGFMNVTFVNRGIDDICQIMSFQTEGESDFWSEPLYYFYPQLNRDHACSWILSKSGTISKTL